MILELTQKTEYDIYNSDYIYTYDKFIDDLKDIQIYINHIYSLIDEADHFYLINDSNKFDKILDYTLYEKIIINKEYIRENKKVYNIESEEAKQKLKDNFKINLSIPGEREPIEFKINHINITYNIYEYFKINFLLNNEQIALLSSYDGYISEWRKCK